MDFFQYISTVLVAKIIHATAESSGCQYQRKFVSRHTIHDLNYFLCKAGLRIMLISLRNREVNELMHRILPETQVSNSDCLGNKTENPEISLSIYSHLV